MYPERQLHSADLSDLQVTKATRRPLKAEVVGCWLAETGYLVTVLIHAGQIHSNPGAPALQTKKAKNQSSAGQVLQHLGQS